MPFNIATELSGIFGFLRRYGAFFEEIIEIINGFKTTTEGVYNPIFSKPKWKSVRKRYDEVPFEFHHTDPLVVFSDKETSKKLSLPVKQNISYKRKDNISVLHDMTSIRITSLAVIKQCYDKINTKKIHISQDLTTINVNSLTINTWLKSTDSTPLSVLFWLKKTISIKLGVFTWLTSKVHDRIEDKTYLLDDVGTISDIEMLDIIGEVESIRAI